MASIFPVSHLKSQDFYETNTGKLIISTAAKDTLITVHSKSAKVYLDYEHAEFKIEVSIGSFHLDINKAGSNFFNNGMRIILVEGKLGINSISTDPHLPLSFDISGNINSGENRTSFLGRGELVHVYGSEHLACLLQLNFEIPSSSQLLTEEYSNPIQIQLFQSLLEQHKHSDH